MRFEAKKLVNTSGWFYVSSPFLRFFRTREDGNPLKVHETERVQKNLNPKWQQFEVKMQKLCNGDPYRPIRVECWSHKKNGKHQPMGESQFSIQDIRDGKREFLIRKNNKNAGSLYLANFASKANYEFLDYIRGGEELNLICAIDFTGSNGVPS